MSFLTPNLTVGIISTFQQFLGSRDLPLVPPSDVPDHHCLFWSGRRCEMCQRHVDAELRILHEIRPHSEITCFSYVYVCGWFF